MVRIRQAAVSTVEVSAKTIWQHVTLTSDDGLHGIGEYTLNDFSGELDAATLARARELVGREADVASLGELFGDRPTTLTDWTILSALDQALMDLSAQRAGVSLAEHLGAASGERAVGLYANINRRIIDRSPEGFMRSAKAAVDAGHVAVKLAPFDGVTPERCETPEGAARIAAGLERVAATVSVAAPAQVRVDCHWRFTPRLALDLVPTLADIGIVWFECPIAEIPDAIPDLRRIRSACNDRGIRLAGCETFGGLEEFRPFVEGGAYDVIMPDVKHAGGLNEVLRIGEAAQAHNVGCSIHNPSGPVAHLFSVHASLALGGSERLEFQFDESPLFTTVTEPAPVLAGGMAAVPEGVGLGAQLAETEAPARH